MAEDVALGGPLVVKPGGPVGTVHPAAGPWDCRAQNIASGNPKGPSPTPASIPGSVLGDSHGISPADFPSSFWTDTPMSWLDREDMGQK